MQTTNLDRSALIRSRLRFVRLCDNIRGILDTVREPFVVLDENLRIRMANKSFCQTFGLSPKEINNQYIDALGKGAWKSPLLRIWLTEGFDHTSEPPDFELEGLFTKIGRRTMLLHARRVQINGVSRRIILLTIDDVTLRRQAEKAMKKINGSLRNDSMTDELTGLYNRRGFLTLSEQYLELAQRRQKKIFVIYVDVDSLKQINDQGGHSKGDELLVRAASILRKTFRKADIVARIGGDEFAIVAMENGHDSSVIQMARLRSNLLRHTAENRHLQPISLSVGFAHSELNKPCVINELLAQADARMFVEKQGKKTSDARARARRKNPNSRVSECSWPDNKGEPLMNKAFGLALVVVGVLLLIAGVNASRSVGSAVSNLLTGSPSNKALWLEISGVAAMVFGIISASRRSV